MTVAPGGAGYTTPAGATVTTQIALTGQYTCAGCGATTNAVTTPLTEDPEYDHGSTLARTNWAALAHAKTCTGRPTPEAP